MKPFYKVAILTLLSQHGAMTSVALRAHLRITRDSSAFRNALRRLVDEGNIGRIEPAGSPAHEPPTYHYLNGLNPDLGLTLEQQYIRRRTNCSAAAVIKQMRLSDRKFQQLERAYRQSIPAAEPAIRECDWKPPKHAEHLAAIFDADPRGFASWSEKRVRPGHSLPCQPLVYLARAA